MPHDEAPVELPLLALGATGFSPNQRQAIETALGRLASPSARWRLQPFADGDAWWVNGSRVQVLRDGNLRVGAGVPTEHALHLNLEEVDRPIAFSQPLATREFQPHCEFRLDREATMQPILRDFENWLRLVRAQFALGAMVMRRGPALRQTLQHLEYGGQLLAVLDYREGVIGIHPKADPALLWVAEWHKRPPAAHGLPAGFVECTPAQLLWAYLRRTQQELLPERYRTSVIHFRHPPRVPVRWVRDSQLAILRELRSAPTDLQQLQLRTGYPHAVIAHDLSCLYYVGSVTTTASKAAPASAPGDLPESTGVGGGWSPSRPGLVGGDLTAPVSLGVMNAGQDPRDA